MTLPRLRTVFRTTGVTAALKNGEVAPSNLLLAFEEVPVLVNAFRRMVRELAYDICEMALTTYLCARAHGKPFTGLPIFLVRGLHHDKVLRHVHSGLRTPKDLKGQTVGVHRGYTVTTGVWARGLMSDEYGLDLDSITWLLSGDEHVAEYKPPANVVRLVGSSDLVQLMFSGEIQAGVNLQVDHPDLAPLVPNPTQAALQALKQRDFYPINHLLVVRDEVLERSPDVAVSLFHAFAEAKNLYLQGLATDVEPVSNSDETIEVHRRVMEITGKDPLPYGIEPNRKMLETLIRYATEQHIIPETVSVSSLFPTSTHDLVA